MPRLNPIDTKKVGYSALSDKFTTKRLIGNGIIPPEMFTSAGDISIPEVLIDENIENLTEIENETPQLLQNISLPTENVVGDIEPEQEEIIIDNLLENNFFPETIIEKIVEKNIISKEQLFNITKNIISNEQLFDVVQNIIPKEQLPNIIQNIINTEQINTKNIFQDIISEEQLSNIIQNIINTEQINTENIFQNIQPEKIEQIIQEHIVSVIQSKETKEIITEGLVDTPESPRIEAGEPIKSDNIPIGNEDKQTIIERLNEKTNIISEIAKTLEETNIINNNTQFIKESPITQNLIGGVEETNIINEENINQQEILNDILTNNISNTILNNYNEVSQENIISNDQNISNINNFNKFTNINNTNTKSNISQTLFNQINNPILNSFIGSNIGFIPETDEKPTYVKNQNDVKPSGFGNIDEIYQKAIKERQEQNNFSQKILEPIGIITPNETTTVINQEETEKKIEKTPIQMTYEDFSKDVKQYNPNISENIIKRQYDNYLLKQETIKTIEKNEEIFTDTNTPIVEGNDLRTRYENQNNLLQINNIINLIKSKEIQNLFKNYILSEYKTSEEIEKIIEEKINKYNTALGLDLDGKL